MSWSFKKKDYDDLMNELKGTKNNTSSIWNRINESNNKLKRLVDLNEKVEYNTYITKENSRKFNYSKKFLLLWWVISFLLFFVVFLVYRKSVDSEVLVGLKENFKLFIDFISNGIVVLVIMPVSGFISYKMTGEGDFVGVSRTQKNK